MELFLTWHMLQSCDEPCVNWLTFGLFHGKKQQQQNFLDKKTCKILNYDKKSFLVMPYKCGDSYSRFSNI